MKRFILGMSVVLATAAYVSAQDSVIFLDLRDNSAATGLNAITGTVNAVWSNDNVNSGRRGAGQVLRLESQHADGWQTNATSNFPNLDGDTNRSTGNLWVYQDVIDDTSGTNDVISSVGVNEDTVPPATIRNTIADLGYVMNNDNTVLNSVTPPAPVSPWNGVTNGAIAGAAPAPDWTGAKAVAVPVTTGPVYSSTNRLIPNFAAGAYSATSTTVPYRLGRYRFTAGTRNCTFAAGHTTNSSYNVFLSVNNLLITRVYETLGDATENVSFGFSGAAVDAAVSGSTNGAVSAVADGVVVVAMKGDFNGDGRVTSADTGGYSGAVSDPTDNFFQAYNGDFNGSATVTSGDTAGFNDALLVRSPSCP